MGAIKTSNILLIGLGVGAVYFMTRPKQPTLPLYPPGVVPPGVATANPTGAAITAGASIVNNLINSIWG